MFDFLLPIWNPYVVSPLAEALRFIVHPLVQYMPAGVAGALAIVIFTIALRLVLFPLTLAQVRSQRAQMAIAPEIRALQKKFKGDREGFARAQMALYKERGVNPMAGCLPMVIQMPILFGMYAALLHLATLGLTLDHVSVRQIQPGQVTYAATRNEGPYPTNQFIVAVLTVVPTGNQPVQMQIPQASAGAAFNGTQLLVGTQGLTLTPGQTVGNTNPPNTPNDKATLFLRPGGVDRGDGYYDISGPVQAGHPYLVQVVANATNGQQVNEAHFTATYSAGAAQVTQVTTPPLQDLAFKSGFLWIESLGLPDVFHVPGLPFALPGVLLLVMTVTSYVSQRMSTMPATDPSQEAMMRTMGYMPLIYLVFFLGTPSGLVLYWLTSNLFTTIQQYFTVGMGLLGGDLQKLTGRDFQPSWSVVRQLERQAQERALAERAGETGEGEPAAAPSNGTSPVGNGHAAALERRPRTAPGKGRKRGKR